MTRGERLALADRIDVAIQEIGILPLSEEWMYTAIRHCERNMDIEYTDEGEAPDRYAGTALARLANMAPVISAALRALAQETD